MFLSNRDLFVSSCIHVTMLATIQKILGVYVALDDDPSIISEPVVPFSRCAPSRGVVKKYINTVFG